MQIFTEFDLLSTLAAVRERGYAFVDQAILPEVCAGLAREANVLPLQVGDHVATPLQAGTSTQVQQRHARFYRLAGHPDVPFASAVCEALPEAIMPLTETFPELRGWLLHEIGYQRYRGPADWISPHRDRRSDKLLSLTITMEGQAVIRIHRSRANPPDYTDLGQIDEHLARPGTAFLLRAPGFGSGEQIIHEVMPPLSGDRLIVNLRMRNGLLPAPASAGY